MATKKTKHSPTKPSVKNRTLTPNTPAGAQGQPFQEQDIKRRIGNFEGKGEPPRKGARTSGIVGQTRAKFSTDKKSK